MKRILIVDDAATVRMFLRAQLDGLGHYETDEATNGVEAIEKALTGAYDLMVVDVNMPKMDGYSLVREIRTRPDLMATPVLMVTTENAPADRVRAYAAGANLHLSKPVDPGAFCAAVRMLAGVAA